MTYEVKIVGDGTHKVLEDGLEVPGATVLRVEFPNVTTHTIEGQVHHISGRATAKVRLADGRIVTDVPCVA